MKPVPLAYKRYVSRIAEDLRREFFLHEYSLAVPFFDHIDDSPHATATMNTDDRYLRLRLSVSKFLLEHWHARKYRHICQILVHEFCHVLTDPLYKLAVDATTNSSSNFLEDIRERQTQRMANILFTRLPKKFWMPETSRPAKKKRK